MSDEFARPEIDLEIAIRSRLAQTIEDRIAWAELLRQCLHGGKSSVHGSFKDAALNALKLLEKPLDFLYDRDKPFFIHEDDVQVQPSKPPPRPPPRPKVINPRKHGKFLYTRSADQLHILQCPTCQKSQFTNLQGLYNHARIMHQLEWGTHEECVRACSIPKEDLDVVNGLEITITLLGVRGLFQKAVENAPRDVNLNSTLGLHADTPALASVLGKEVKRREIRVHDEDVDVDLDSTSSPHRWKITHVSRNDALHYPNQEPALVHLQPEAAERSSTPLLAPTPGASRFYITARIIIADRSLYIPPTNRPKDAQFTHKWMLSVESPSYSLDITTILARVTAVSASDHIDFAPIVATEPPFVVMGSAKRPFLCQLELLFNPARGQYLDGQPVVLEHWVDIDYTKAKYPIKADEQVLDVELHKETIIQPTKKGYLPVDSRLHWKSTSVDTSAQSTQTPLSEAHEMRAILRPIARNHPLTSSVKRDLPYMIVASSSFEKLIIGRQKAIEWGRARAIRDAYVRHVEDTHRIGDLPKLSTVDVLRWLQADERKTRVASPSVDEKWCLICGLTLSTHPTGNLETGCSVIPEVPTVEINIQSVPHSMFSFQTQFDPNMHIWINERIVAASEPRMLLAIKGMARWSVLKPRGTVSFPLDEFGPDVAEALAPYGVLTLATQQFIRRLISGAAKCCDGKVITPTHVLQGLVAGKSKDRVGEAMFYALGRLGRTLTS